SVTRVRIRARANGTTKGVTAVQLRYAYKSTLTPFTTILAESPMYENTLGAVYDWKEFTFTDVTGIPPDQALCLVLAMQVRDKVLADIQYEDVGGSGRLVSFDQGSTWGRYTSQSLLCQVYGTVTAEAAEPNNLAHILIFVHRFIINSLMCFLSVG
ncbi:hypothetical protein ACFL6U_23165, partial [Planctomycetota bacterium]